MTEELFLIQDGKKDMKTTCDDLEFCHEGQKITGETLSLQISQDNVVLCPWHVPDLIRYTMATLRQYPRI